MAKRLLALGFIITATHLFAQVPIDGVHYPAGLNGIKAGIPEAPGIYLRDDNWIYSASTGFQGDYDTLVYMQAPQVMWLSEWTVLGAHFGVDAMVPLIYKEANYALAVDYPSGQRVSGPISQTRFGLGDIKLEPLLLAWHWDQWDLMTAGAVWVPTGHHITTSGDNLGDGNWSPMATLGAVWHPDEARTWSLSILNHYEFNCQQTDGYFHYIRQPPFPRITYGFENSPSSTYTLECAVGKTVFDHTDVGVSGYYQQQFTDGYDRYNLEKDSSVTGAGPEVSVNIPGWDLTASLRYDYEFAAHDRPRGNVIDLSVTKRF